MFFRNLSMYRLSEGWAMTADQLHEALEQFQFTDLTASEVERAGWISPRRNTRLAHSVGKQVVLSLKHAKKVIPSSAVSAALEVKAKELEDSQGFPPGKKARKELRENIMDQLTTTALPTFSVTNVWLDFERGFFAVDTATASKADQIVKHILKAVDRFPLTSLRVQRSPVAVMTAWLEMDEMPFGFTCDQDAILRATGESKAAIHYKRHTLEVDDVRRHIAAGKQCTRLAMTWRDKVSFQLDANLTIRGLRPLDVLRESDSVTRDDHERYDADLTLMADAYGTLVGDLIVALGGEAEA